MLSSAALEGAQCARTAVGGSLGSIWSLAQLAVLHGEGTQHPCRALSYLGAEGCRAPDGQAGAAQSCYSGGSSGSNADSVPSSTGKGGVLGGLQHQVLSVLQRRGISLTPSTSYEFQSNLTRYAKSKVANRDNFQRWRDSGRDVRVAQDILREAGAAGRRGGGRGGRRGGGDWPRGAISELRNLVMDCRDLLELQVVLRECGRDMDGPLLCFAASRLSKLKQATPAAEAPAALARRIAESLMSYLEDRISEASVPSVAAVLFGLGGCGVLPGRRLLEAATQRLLVPTPRGGRAVLEAEPRVISCAMMGACRMMNLQRQQRQQQGQGQGQQRQGQESRGGSGAGSAAREGAAATRERDEAGDSGSGSGSGGAADALQGQLWPALVGAAEAKLLRALGEDPPGAPAAPVGLKDKDELLVDDSIPQAALRGMCVALALAHERHPGVWTAAARLSARYAGDLEPGVAAAVLRAYATAGGAALDGGRAGLLEAVWAVMEPQLRGGQLEAGALQDLAYAAATLAAAAEPGGGDAASAADGMAATARQILRPVCDALVPWLPKLSNTNVVHLAACLAKAHRAEAAAQPASAPASQQYGALPRLMADLLMLRGVRELGGGREFASLALALGLMGQGDAAFWGRVAAAALPELPRMDGSAISRLLGAFHHAATAAAAAAAAAAAQDGSAPPAAAALQPPADVVVAAHARVMALLGGADGAAAGAPGEGGGGGAGFTVREAFFVLRCLAEWPLPEGGAGTLSRLGDRLVGGVAAGEGGLQLSAAQPATLEQMVRTLRDAGLGEHRVLALLEGRQE